jgi:hypothetical protein
MVREERHKKKMATATGTNLAVLAAEFKSHVLNESEWQAGVKTDLKEIKEMLQPMVLQIQENTIALYGIGPDKSNGLRGDMKGMRAWKDVVDARWWKLVAIAFALQVVLNVATPFVKNVIFPTAHTAEQVK